MQIENYIVLLCIPAAVVMFVVMANIPYKLSVILFKWNLLYKTDYFIQEIINIYRPIEQTFKKSIRPIPLISCELCLTFWLSLTYSLFHFDIMTSLALAGAMAYLTGPLKKLL